MFRDFVPEGVRPWIYLLFAFFFQLSGSVYFAQSAQMMGEWSLMREDVQMIAMMGVVGVNMPFPFLFRFKLRFTNQQLLINAAVIILVCNLLTLWVTWVPALCAISYVAGFFKLCGTFECFSNIRLWLSPKQDFGVFLPSLYIIILAAMPASNWIAQHLLVVCGSWHAMHWFMAALMLVIILVQFTCCRPWRMMPRPLPLVSLDWLGCFLWSAVMIEIIWLFTYGEYYFYVSPTLNVERLYLPTFLRTFGYAIFFSTMTLYLKELIEFPTFFHALTVSGFIRNGVGESVCSGLYSFGLRRQIADALNRGIHSDYVQVLMVAVKEMFGIMCLVGVFVLLAMLLYDVQPVRSTMRRMMPLKKIGRLISLSVSGHRRPPRPLRQPAVG